DASALPLGKRAVAAFMCVQSVLGKKCTHGDRTQFDADDMETLFGEPDHVQTFAAQRGKNPAGGGEIQTGPEAHEQRIHRCLMKVDRAIPPALQPELIVPPDTQARSSAFTNFSDNCSSVNWGSLGGYSSSSLIGIPYSLLSESISRTFWQAFNFSPSAASSRALVENALISLMDI